MRLQDLTLSPFDVLTERTAGPEEQIALIAAIAARQGKEPGPIVKDIRSQIDPAYGERQRGRAKFSDWIKTAKMGETVEGKAFNRKLRVTTLDGPEGAPVEEPPVPLTTPSGETKPEFAVESILRESVVTVGEARFRRIVNEDLADVGKLVINALRKLVGDEPESPKTKKALDEFPALSAIARYARQSKEDISGDSKFWDLVDKVTDGRGEDVRKAVEAVHEIEEAKENEKVIILEARLSEILVDVGLSPDSAQEIMRTHELKDIEYDLGEVRRAMTSPEEPREVQSADPAKVEKPNREFAFLVIKAAAAILRAAAQAEAQAADQQAADASISQAVNQVAGGLSDPSVVDPSASLA